MLPQLGGFLRFIACANPDCWVPLGLKLKISIHTENYKDCSSHSSRKWQQLCRHLKKTLKKLEWDEMTYYALSVALLSNLTKISIDMHRGGFYGLVPLYRYIQCWTGPE
jgi:hypothetical protein